MQRQRRRGLSWAPALDGEETPDMVPLLRASIVKMAGLLRDFTMSSTQGLSHEGASHGAIARRLGVTHQRVTAMLKERAPDDGPL
jgi:hypothetical protein